MNNFISQSPYFHLVVLFLCFTLSKIWMPTIDSNPLKMPVVDIQEGLSYFFINDVG